jgi:hypothetical protein
MPQEDCFRSDWGKFISCIYLSPISVIRNMKLGSKRGSRSAEILTFMCPCIDSIIINDDQKDATTFDLFISSLLYMSRTIFSPIIRST